MRHINFRLILVIVAIMVIATTALVIAIRAQGDPLIQENVNFRELTYENTRFFEVEDEKRLALNISGDIKVGKLTVEIIDPKDQVVYVISGKDFNVKATIDVYPGQWSYRIVCNGEDEQDAAAQRGRYSIQGRLK